MHKIMVSLLGLMFSITCIILLRQSESKNVRIAPEVEAAINSIEPVTADIPANIGFHYQNVALGDWSHFDAQCLLPQEWKDGHISMNNLKRKEVVLKKADELPTQ